MALLMKLFEIIKNLLLAFLSKKGSGLQALPPAPQIELGEPQPNNYVVSSKLLKNIICNGKPIPIEWDNVLTFEDADGLTIPEKNYRRIDPPQKRIPKLFTVHWDGCLSTKSCVDVLEKRGLSVHFCIDNDGTIYQLMDTQHVAWHARGVNTCSVGVEISNACHLKYKGYYNPRRPVVKNAVVHGKKLKPFMGFYPVQIEALKALIKVLHKTYNIPLKCPVDNGKLVTTVYYDVIKKVFSGVIGHYHVSFDKTDPGNLDFQGILSEIEKEIEQE